MFPLGAAHFPYGVFVIYANILCYQLLLQSLSNSALFVALMAPLGERAIVVEMTLCALGAKIPTYKAYFCFSRSAKQSRVLHVRPNLRLISLMTRRVFYHSSDDASIQSLEAFANSACIAFWKAESHVRDDVV
ncbi:hypothetical protein Tco_0637038 [Tanacetum coccineum]|uniref:Uncharacterized protein n=1 Tax=Tanacetum coccineum TaxID=301880 RepID=A0ABQ5G879_9ASTR